MIIINGYVREFDEESFIILSSIHRIEVKKTVSGSWRIYGYGVDKVIYCLSESYDSKERAEYELRDALKKAECRYICG